MLLDILIIIPQLLLNAFGTPRDGPMLQLYISGSNTIFLFVAICTALGMVRIYEGRGVALAVGGRQVAVCRGDGLGLMGRSTRGGRRGCGAAGWAWWLGRAPGPGGARQIQRRWAAGRHMSPKQASAG